MGTERSRGPSAQADISVAKVAAALMSVVCTLLWPRSGHAWDAPMCTAHVDAGMCDVRLPRGLACWDSTAPVYSRVSARDGSVARRAFEALEEHQRALRIPEALVSLASLRTLVPELSDRWDTVEGQLFPAERRGCEAWSRATSSVNSAIAARARVGFVRCLLATNDRRAARELRVLLTRYPELPDALALRVLDAQMRERRGDFRGAIAIYRDIDVSRPEQALAAEAREALARLSSSGHRVRPLTSAERLARADRIVRLGAPELARREIENLLGMRWPPRERAQVMLLAARVARVEGRFEDADALTQQAAARTVGSASASQARTSTEEGARAELTRLLGSWRTLERIPTARLLEYLRTAARAHLREELHRALDAVTSRSLPCRLRLEAGVVASGSAEDERVVRVLDECTRARGTIGVAARYHRARALERLGRAEEARRELSLVVDQDRSETRWYALWSRQRLELDAVRGDRDAVAVSRAETDHTKTGELDQAVRVTPVALRGASASSPSSSGQLERDALAHVDRTASPHLTTMGRARTERGLEDLARRHGEAFPWFGRALATLRLGDALGATEELHEAALAWHEARGLSPVRAGVEAVYRGASPPRRAVSRDLWRARRALPNEDRLALARVAASLGDHGLAVRFGGRGHAATRPRAYEDIVTEIAEARDLDPNLLLAVMRVESVYNPRIVSYAGAVGLMQIMPRTGRLIARSLGRESEFGVDDLLEPRTNLEFAAWYLSSLIRRFEGRVPLAIASYNGGPHNVRRWLNEHSSSMPLDAFLERIPFTQTHRYVRRVLSHWAAYRAQQGLPMIELDPTLPELSPDRVAF